MQRVPDAMFVIDLKTEAIAVREAQRLRIPIIGLVDTNCDPDGIDYVIPGNDDAIRACALITHAIGDVVQQGRARFRAEEEQARAEAAAQQQREAEERARREAEEQAAAEAAKRAEAEAALTQAGEGEPRDVAEAQVAEAVQAAPAQAAGTASAEAAAAAQAAEEPAAAAAGAPARARPRRTRPPRRRAPTGERRRPRPSRSPPRRRRRAEPRPPRPRPSRRGRRDRRGRGDAEAPAEEPRRAARPRPAAEAAARRRDQDRGQGERSDRSHHHRQAGQGAARAHRRGHDGLQEGARPRPTATSTQAVELLRVRLGDKALKVGGREATEGTVASYIHSNGKVGVLVEVDCNTDFVARNEDFSRFARDIALHIAASPATLYVSEDEIPQEAKDAELRVFEQQAADKPENIRPKIAEGKLKAWMKRRRPAQPAARQRGQVRGQDDRAAAREALRHDRRERRDPPLRPLRGRRVSRR